MRKDTKSFRNRFQRWKAGEKVYDAGRVVPLYAKGKDPGDPPISAVSDFPEDFETPQFVDFSEPEPGNKVMPTEKINVPVRNIDLTQDIFTRQDAINNVKDWYKNDFAERLIKQHPTYNTQDIVNEVNVPKIEFKKLEPGTVGYYRGDKNYIAISEPSTPDFGRKDRGLVNSSGTRTTIAHEMRHHIDQNIKRTPYEQKLLHDAYYLKSPKEYSYIEDEYPTVNTEYRFRISDMNNGATGKDLDNIITNMPDEQIIRGAYDLNWYTNNKKLDFDKMTPEEATKRAEAIRKALMEVAYAPQKYNNAFLKNNGVFYAKYGKDACINPLLPKYKKGKDPKNLIVNGAPTEAIYNPDEDLYEATITPFKITVNANQGLRPPYDKSRYGFRYNPNKWVSANTKQLSASDALKGVHTAVNPLLGWTSPSQYVGAIRDSKNVGEFIGSMMGGNSGFTTEEYAQKHPIISTALNLAGDAIGTAGIVKGGVKAYDAAKNVVNNKGFALVNPSGNSIRWIGKGVGSHIDLEDAGNGYLMPTYIKSTKSGTGEKLYNAAIKLAQKRGYKGIESGRDLVSAPKTYSTWEHYPNKQLLGNYGKHGNREMVFGTYQANDAKSAEELIQSTANNVEQIFPNAPVYGLNSPSYNVPTFKLPNIRTPHSYAQLRQKQYENMVRGITKYNPNDKFSLISSADAGSIKRIPDPIIKEMRNTTIPRMQAMRPWMQKKDVENQINNIIDTEYGEFPTTAFKKAGQKNGFAGSYNPDSDFINMAKGEDPYLLLPHELRHKIDSHMSLTEEEERYLTEAFGQDFLDVTKDPYVNKGLEDYAHMASEMVTTNRDARGIILGPHHSMKLPVELQNKIIDAVPDQKIMEAISNANGYGRRFVDHLLGDSPFDVQFIPKSRIQAWRNAMKYVGGFIPPALLFKANNNRKSKTIQTMKSE